MENGYKVAVLSKQQFAVVSSFPLKTGLSLYVAIFRVYPRLRQYIADMGLCAYPAIEIADRRTMHFMMPLSRQEEFFVPEFCEEQISIATTEMSTAVDHSALADEDALRTSSRNSRKSEEKNPLDKSHESGGSHDNPNNTSNALKQEIKEMVAEEENDFSCSSFEDLKGEKL